MRLNRLAKKKKKKKKKQKKKWKTDEEGVLNKSEGLVKRKIPIHGSCNQLPRNFHRYSYLVNSVSRLKMVFSNYISKFYEAINVISYLCAT